MTEGRDRRAARWEAIAFATGSLCFLIGPVPGYSRLVGGVADAVTFFVGSLLFTTGGALQVAQAVPGRRTGGRSAWRTAMTQSVGTVSFNVSTAAALLTAVSASGYDRLVWRPDAIGSLCFLASGAIGYLAAPRRRWRLVREGRGWWRPGVNLLGCVWFGVAAVAGYVVPGNGSALGPAVSGWTTSAGAACFLACALASLPVARPGAPRIRSDRAEGARSRAAGPGRRP